MSLLCLTAVLLSLELELAAALDEQAGSLVDTDLTLGRGGTVGARPFGTVSAVSQPPNRAVHSVYSLSEDNSTIEVVFYFIDLVSSHFIA
jgi:hypothetical protein